MGYIVTVTDPSREWRHSTFAVGLQLELAELLNGSWTGKGVHV